ncbi:hypothetical protein H5410_019950 [Solanum commersonii]|uniref:Uncharacterized protein n=1 Tax=Solanum commersonii TaxID=4109 RepID=A0A9J5Z8S7_SOLCO|nr:hypothetical protein H5410_019950 [Solanum commersonii]
MLFIFKANTDVSEICIKLGLYSSTVHYPAKRIRGFPARYCFIQRVFLEASSAVITAKILELVLQLQDIALDEVCLSDDLIVPRPSCEHANEFLSRIDNCKKPWYEVIGLLRTIGEGQRSSSFE